MADTFDNSRLTGVGSPADIAAAVRGERVPETVSGTATLCCLVRGIRYNDGFAQELHGIPELPQITRALNARAIMSNRIPEMTTPEEFPYCFWHPSLPTEQTLHELLRRYPDNTLLPYQVGRACAAGGYTDLYHELGLLPDVAIAEEARDNCNSGQMIYQAVMQAPIRYSYMDDYICQLREKPIPGACLNGDTCVRSLLDQRYSVGRNTYPILPKMVLDITEDQCIDVQGVLPGDRPVSPAIVQLLYSPLPADLPSVDKDLLILMAAWTGNIDRYDRLRRPCMVDGELACVVRGIYHHPFFAKWWNGQPGPDKNLRAVIRQAVHARCIMNNDLSWLSATTPPTELPEMIWFPQKARPAIYIELARRQPRMATLAARACMHANYQNAFDQVGWELDARMWVEAQHVSNTHYLSRIEEKAAMMGISDCEEEFLPQLEEDISWQNQWPMAVIAQEWPHFHPDGTQSLTLVPELTVNHVGFQHPEETTTHSMVGQVLLHACVADESIRPTPVDGEINLGEMYHGKEGRVAGRHRGSGRGRGRGRGRGGQPH